MNNGKSAAGKLSFSEIGQLADVHRTDWSWSVLMGDYDNDGCKDIFITNGFLRDLQDLDFIRYVNRPSSFSGLKRDKKFFLEMAAGSSYYQDRLYVNDGAGNFTKKKNALPEFKISGSCVPAADFDQDGDFM